jgi:hypothetical protein
MPKNATLAQRVAWHVAHQKACACRPLPASVAAALASRPPKVHAARSRPGGQRRWSRSGTNAIAAPVKAQAQPQPRARQKVSAKTQ